MMLSIYFIATVLFVICLAFSRNSKVQDGLMITFLMLQLRFCVYACCHLREDIMSYFNFDALGVLLLVVLTIICIPVFIHSRIYLAKPKAKIESAAVYYAALVLLVAAMSLSFLANHVAVNWIFTEITTLSAALLIYHHRNKLALEGTWKYVFICAISISFVFIGILFLSLSLMHAGAHDLSYKCLIASAQQLDTFWLKLAFIFIFTGYTAKIGLFPMFTAGIDAKDKAPAPAGAFLAGILVNVGFIGIFRVFGVVANSEAFEWCRHFMLITALITLFVASAYMVKLHNVKRMLAYSGVEHMAIVMLGLAIGGVGYVAAIMHLIMHSFVKSGLFLHFTQMYRLYQSKLIDDMGGYFKHNPFGAMVLLFGFFCIMAIPPSGLFVSEFFIFKAMIDARQILVFALTAFFLTVIIWAIARSVMQIIFLPAKREISGITFSPWESVSQLILFLIAAYIGINPPEILLTLINESISMLAL